MMGWAKWVLSADFLEFQIHDDLLVLPPANFVSLFKVKFLTIIFPISLATMMTLKPNATNKWLTK